MCIPYIESQKWLPWQRPSAPLRPICTIPTAHPSPQPNGISICSAVFAQMTAECPYTLQWDAPLLPQNCPLPMGGSGPNLIHGSFGPPESSTQTASRSVKPFLSGLTSVTDRPTDNTTRSVTIGRIYVRCGLIIS